MNKKDNHYETLNVNENSTQDDIKKAYRKLSLKWHPDKNQNSSESNHMFQKINSAFEILGDPEKKKQYDNPFMRNDCGNGSGIFNEAGLEGLFENLFFGGLNGIHPMFPNQKNSGLPNGFHIFTNGIPVNPVNFLQKPSPIIYNLKVNIENILIDRKVPIEIERWILENDNKILEKQTLYVDIPKGIDDNEIIVLKDKGNIVNEQIKGDLKIIINVENNTNFQRNGLDLIYEKNISLKESLCGFTFDLKYINGKVYTINNNKGNIIKPNYNKIINNMGLTRENITGNLIIKFNVEFPETLSLDQIEQINNSL